MKDKRLEQEFEEYFKGVSTPNDITADAKKYVRRKSSFMPKFLKFASVAASCVLVVTLSVIIFMKSPLTPAPPSDSTAAPSADCYYDSDLTATREDAYSLPDNSHLKLITRLAYSSNANVSDCVTYYSGNELLLFSAKVDMLSSLTRYEVNVYIEFTRDRVYAPLKDYAEGEKGNYCGADYYVTQTVAENGEPQFKLCVYFNGVKYYFNIISSDMNAYIKYLEFIVKNY